MGGREECGFGIGFGVLVDADDEKVIGVRGLESLEPRRFGLARAAPRRPEIQDDSFAEEPAGMDGIAAQRPDIQRIDVELFGCAEGVGTNVEKRDRQQKKHSGNAQFRPLSWLIWSEGTLIVLRIIRLHANLYVCSNFTRAQARVPSMSRPKVIASR